MPTTLSRYYSFRKRFTRHGNPANIRLDEDVLKTSWRHLQRNNFLSFKTSWRRRLTDTSSRRLEETSWRRLAKTFWRRLWKRSWKHVLEDVLKTSWKRLEDVSRKRFEDVFGRGLANTSWRRLEDILKTSWKIKNCYAEDVFQTSSRRLQDVLENKKCLLGNIIKIQTCKRFISSWINEDIRQIKSSPNVFVFAGKTNNIYEMLKETFTWQCY